MEWIDLRKKKPEHAQAVLLYGQLRDTEGAILDDVIDRAIYLKKQDYFTIGTTTGQWFKPLYWMPLVLPELYWPQKDKK